MQELDTSQKGVLMMLTLQDRPVTLRNPAEGEQTRAYVMCLVSRHLDVPLTRVDPALVEITLIAVDEDAFVVSYGYAGGHIGEVTLFDRGRVVGYRAATHHMLYVLGRAA